MQLISLPKNNNKNIAVYLPCFCINSIEHRGKCIKDKKTSELIYISCNGVVTIYTYMYMLYIYILHYNRDVVSTTLIRYMKLLNKDRLKIFSSPLEMHFHKIHRIFRERIDRKIDNVKLEVVEIILYKKITLPQKPIPIEIFKDG